ncbi:putative reverse transcriptase domain-containing protein [Tanacetum coccineum]|uniref:Reverse transcriptase domain-containing protein n=1 Tax=Tanacetum coccineum TaxID=301880 RepID=A0ABQ4ZNS0_9ASTR
MDHPFMPEDHMLTIMAAYEVPPSPDYNLGPEFMPREDEILPFRGAAIPACCRHPLQIYQDMFPRRGTREEEEEHPALADSVPPVHRMTARISIRDEPSISLPPWGEECVLLLPPSHEAGESSAAGAARQDRPAIARDDPYSIARRDLYGFIDMVDIAPGHPMSRELDYGITDTWDDLRLPPWIGLFTSFSSNDRRERGAECIVLEYSSSRSQETEGDFRVVGIRPQETENGTKEKDHKVKPTPTLVTDTHTTTSITNAQIQAMINEGVTTALAARDANQNGDDTYFRNGCRSRAGTVACQVKFATCTLQGNALTWWNSHVKTTTPEAAHAMPWRTLKKMMTDKYCPRGEIKKLEFEMWNLKVKGTDVVTYSQRFQELALMCDRMFPEEIDQVEKYVGGLPDTIHGSVMATKPKTMQDAIEFATELMDKKINTWAECQADNKRKSDDTARNNQNQQPNKRQNTGRAYAAGNGNSRPYGGPKPLCSKCNYHHIGPCAPKCHMCNRFGHLDRDYRNPPNVNTRANQRGNICFECSAQGHFKKDCPKLKNNNNRGNQVGNAKAQAKVYAVGNAGAHPNNNVVTGTFLLNNRYASILFDTGADRSFVSTAFSSRIVITPTALDHDYNVELADGRIVGLNTIIRGCTLNLLNHPFNIDLIPVELGSFDVLIGMDWLAKYHAVIVCVEKIVRGDGSSNKHGTRLNIILCAKAQEYLMKGCHVFLANITATKDN